jgi:hypothetical protein
MVECFAALQSRLHEQSELADDPFLADIVIQRCGPQRLLDAELFGLGSSGENVSLAGHGAIVAAPSGGPRKGEER